MSNLTNYPISSLLPPSAPEQCVLAAPIYLAIDTDQQSGTNVNFAMLTTFLRAVLPASLTAEASNGTLCDWWANSWLKNANQTSDFVRSIYANCPMEVCMAVDWPGDPDIAGIGVCTQRGLALGGLLRRGVDDRRVRDASGDSVHLHNCRMPSSYCEVTGLF